MYKGQKQLSCNLFCNYFVYHFLHIFTLILATGTFLSAGRKSSQTTALYRSVCEYYVQIASPRVCVEFARSLPMSSRHPSCSEVGTTFLTSDCCGLAWNHRLWSSMPLIWDCEEGTIAQCLAFQLPVTGFFFFFNWPLGLSRVCLDSAKCSIYFSCWAASIFCNMNAHILLHMPPYNTCMDILRSRLWVFPPLPLLSFQ